MSQALQLPLILKQGAKNIELKGSYKEKLTTLLSQDLSFHDHDSQYLSHNLHSFPAKFPPQLPRQFILGLTEKGEKILDPMLGSGTTVVEAYLTGRYGIGFDIDPLALLLSYVKVTPLQMEDVVKWGNFVLKQAKTMLEKNQNDLHNYLRNSRDKKTKKFIDYWFAPKTQIELLALINEIQKINDQTIRSFYKLVFSAIIITKTGGVSLAFDLAHTRPHRAKVVYNQKGDIFFGKELSENPSSRVKLLTKTLRSPLVEFENSMKKSIEDILKMQTGSLIPSINFGDAQSLPLNDSSVDLIVTSPPYAANAIDYMRAHKFSLVWMGYPINELGNKRGEYIGGEAVTGISYEDLPTKSAQKVKQVSEVDKKKGRVLHRYYSEITRTLKEMFRVLKPGKAAIVVIGSSTMRGIDTQSHTALAEIGQTIGFEIPKIGFRDLDRNRRMMPTSTKKNTDSQIQQRMHEEYVIGFYKPRPD